MEKEQKREGKGVEMGKLCFIELDQFVVVLVLLTFVNCWSVVWVNRVQYIFIVAKALAIAVVIVTGCVQLFSRG